MQTDKSGGCWPALVGFAILGAGSALLFSRWPELDLIVSQLFYDPVSGFSLAGDTNWEGVVLVNKWAPFASVGLSVIGLGIALYRRSKADTVGLRYCIFVMLIYALGPGVLVNGILKRTYGRARPVQVEAFGGDGPFAAAWVVSGYCRAACSFVSAEVAAGSALTIGLVIGASWFAGRPIATVFRVTSFASVGLLAVTAIQRVGSGRHFLSDVLFAAILVLALGTALGCMLRPRVPASTLTVLKGQTP